MKRKGRNMKNKKVIDTIIFDAGGVIFYINEFRNQIIKRVLFSIGYKEKVIEKALLSGKKFDSNYFDEYGDICTWQDEKKWLEAKYSFIANVVDNGNTELADRLMILAFDTFQYKLFEDTVPTLEKLKSKYNLSVLSNATASLDWAFDYLDIRKYFDKVIISSYEKCIKPNEELYIIALNKLSKSPEQCIFIDDKIENVEAARDLGIKSFHLVRKNGRTLKDFEDYLETIN